MPKGSTVGLPRLLAAVAFALAGAPAAQAQSWNLYNGYTSSFFVPFVGASAGQPDATQQVNLTLNFGDTTKTTPFTMDTGSTGIAASDVYFRPNARTDTFMGNSSITYTSNDLVESGKLYLTNVVISGLGGNTVTAQVPVLQVLTECPTSNPDCDHRPGKSIAYMGIGFDRGSGPATINKNPFLALVGTNVPGLNINAMRAGYVITNSSNNPNGQAGVTLGLTASNTSGFNTFVKLSANGPNTPGCTAPRPDCVYDWTAPTAQVSVNGQDAGTGKVLPDSGITYMILETPIANQLAAGGTCPAGAAAKRCAPDGTTVQVSLPGLGSGALYQFAVGADGNPTTPKAVAYFNNTMSVNTGVSFYGAIDYLYDAAAGFVGYRWNGASGAIGSVRPLLALQGTVTFDSGFATDFPILLMPGGATLRGPSGGNPGLLYGNVVGPGSLTVASGNYWLMGTDNTFTGGTTVNGGSLTLGAGATLPFAGALALNGGTFDLNGNTQVLGALGGAGGNLAMRGGMLVLNTAQASVLGSSITGGGMLVVQGGGSLDLVGNSGTYSGSSVVAGGSTLSVNGSLGGNVFVGPTGILGGNGAVGGDVFSGGTLAPGNSIGTLTVSGNFTNTANGSYAVEVGGAGAGDRLNVGGRGTLQGGQVVVTALPGMSFAPSTTYTILNAAGGLSGTFTSVNELYPFLLSNLSYDANNAYLTLDIGGFAAAAATPTQAAVGNVLDANVGNATGDFAIVLGALAFNTTSNATAQYVLQSLSGNNYAGFSTAMVQGAQLFMNNFFGQAGGGSGGGAGSGTTRVALAEACEVACDAGATPAWGAWGGALGGLGTLGNGAATGAVTYNAGGFAAGLDRAVAPGARVGITTGYTTGSQWVSGFNGMGRSDTVNVGLYGGYTQGPLYLDALAGYAWSWNQMWRQIAVPGLQQRTALGQTGANQWYGQLEGGWRFELGPQSPASAQAFVTPFARLQAYTGTQNGFTEAGAQSLNLSVAQQTTNSLRSVIGAQLGGSMDLGWRERLAVQLRLGWSHEYADVSRPVTATLAGAPAMPFTTYGISPTRDGVVIGLGANTAIAEATRAYLRYEGNISGQDSAHALTAGLRMTW
ncbi:autotransporter domain-containing protein [Reyranella sp.]|uniref:autotransporter family protein n=1 Tax=Reyranella sp. TaxID=1929291 RepID=UPI003BA9126A